MVATKLLVLTDGLDVDSNGVSFRFSPSISELATRTSSVPAGFSWQWLVFGRIFQGTDGDVREFDGGMICGVHDQRFHAITLPESGGNASTYQNVDLELLKLTHKSKTSLFGKTKVTSVGLQASDTLAMAIEAASTLDADGSSDMTDRLVDFYRALSAPS